MDRRTRPAPRAFLALLGALLLVLPLPGTPVTPAHAVGAAAIANGLAFPAGFAFLSDGRIVYGERFTGEVRFFNPATNADALVWTITNVATAGEQGLLSVVPHPSYPTSPYLYAYATRTVNGAPQNQLIRIRVSNGVGVGMTVLLTIPAAGNHNGGAMIFGPGKKLHVVVGDVTVPANAQDLSKLPGKVLRLNLSGKPARGNPFGTRVFSFGHRNLFGVAIDPQTSRVWVSENGPGCNDEINDIVPGGNFAWGPSQQCGSPADAEDTNRDGPSPRIFPAWLFNPTNAPTGVVFCAGCGLGAETEGTLLMGAWKDGGIRRLTLNATRDGVTASTLIYDHPSGVLTLARGPDGSVYFSDADQIFRLTP